MLEPQPSTPSPLGEDRESRVRALAAQLLPLLEQAARRMAEELVDKPDHELFGAVEFQLRDHAHQLAADAHQLALGAKKRGT